jgi:phosphatidylserine/phosphatidylglycerophosphate/cardiolipin synthase-like enzyme
VVDEERLFVTSANFTEAAHERNIEAGVLIADPVAAKAMRSALRSVRLPNGRLRNRVSALSVRLSVSALSLPKCHAEVLPKCHAEVSASLSQFEALVDRKILRRVPGL